MEQPTEALWKPDEVAKRLGVSVGTVYTLMRTGELRTVVTVAPGRVRARALVPESVVRAWEQRLEAAK